MFLSPLREIYVSVLWKPRREQMPVVGMAVVIKQSPNTAELSWMIQFNITKQEQIRKGKQYSVFLFPS